MTDLIPFFRKIELFQDVTDSELDYLTQFCSTVSFKKGKRIMSTNDTLEYIYIIKSGKVNVFIESHDHKKEYLPGIGKGNLIGEMELFDNQKIIANCESKTNVTLLQIKKNNFKKFLTQTPIVLDRVFTSTVQKWRNIERQFNQNIEQLNDAIEKIKQDEELLFRQQQQIEEESRLKEIFIENISHELRTPLTIIQGVIESLRIEDEKKFSLDKDLYKKLQNSSSYLLDLINELLDFSQLSKGITNLNYNWYNITKELHTMMDTLIFSTLKSGGKDIQISYDLPEPIHLFIDIKRIRQILFHLISNAVKFTEQGSIEITITCTDFVDETCTLLINVKDTGIGISEDDQKIIFNKFVRLKNKYYTLRGTGLGLSLVKTLVDLMHGTIDIESRLEVGTEFKLKIPLSYKKIQDNQINGLDSNKKAKRKLPINVLLIDDYEDTHVIVKALLRKYNITIDSLFDSTNVLKTINNNQYDIILLDIMLPEVDGYKILEILRDYYKKDSKNTDIPKIIAFTALRSEIELEKINKAGFDGLLLKPFTKDDLLNTVLPIV